MKAQPRAAIGRGAVKRLRAEGLVPAVVYGARQQPVSLAINLKDLEKVLHHGSSENVLVDLQVEENGQTTNRLTLIQEVQHHPVEDTVLHVDFHEVSATEKLRTAVPVHAVGEPAGVKTGGGVLEFVMRELRVECLPKDLPDVIEVNVEALEIGQGIHISQISPPAGVTLLDDKGQAVFIVAAPAVEEEVVATTELAEPEVIGEKKEEGEEGEAVEGEGKKGEAKPKAEAGKADAKAAAGGKGEAKPGAVAAGKAEAKPAAGKAAAGKGAPAGKAAPAGKGAPAKPEGKK